MQHDTQIAISELGRDIKELRLVIEKLERRLTAIEPLVYEANCYV